MSNVLGTINPIAEIAEMARAAGALLLVDGAQSAPHLPVDVEALGCDVFAFSAHKMLGPTGVGVLWARPGLLAEMEPFLGGGEMISIVKPEGSTWAEGPHKFEAGTPNIADVIAFGAALDYLRDLGMAEVREHEKRITAYAIDTLEGSGGITVHGPHDVDVRGGAVSFEVEGVHPHDVSTIRRCVRRRDPGGAPLRAAADAPPERSGDEPGELLPLQRRTRSRCARGGARRGETGVWTCREPNRSLTSCTAR